MDGSNIALTKFTIDFPFHFSNNNNSNAVNNNEEEVQHPPMIGVPNLKVNFCMNIHFPKQILFLLLCCLILLCVVLTPPISRLYYY